MNQVDHVARMAKQDPDFPDYDTNGWPSALVVGILNVREDTLRLREVAARLIGKAPPTEVTYLLRLADSLDAGAEPAARYMDENAGPGLGMQVVGAATRCDGNHAGPSCGDIECWNDGVPRAHLQLVADFLDPQDVGNLPAPDTCQQVGKWLKRILAGSDGGPATPSAEWRKLGEEDPHANRYDGERSDLCMGDLSDDALANEAFLNYDRRPTPQQIIAGTHHMPLAYMTAVKDRIRWLSRALERELARNAPSPTSPGNEGDAKPPGVDGLALMGETVVASGDMRNSLAQEKIEQIAVAAGLREELWFGKDTPPGYQDTMPKLLKFAELIAALPAQGAQPGTVGVEGGASSIWLAEYEAKAGGYHLNVAPMEWKLPDGKYAIYATPAAGAPVAPAGAVDTRKPWEKSSWTCARARVDMEGVHCPETGRCPDCIATNRPAPAPGPVSAAPAAMEQPAPIPQPRAFEQHLRAIVKHWNEFGPEHGHGELMDIADSFLQSVDDFRAAPPPGSVSAAPTKPEGSA